MFADFIADDLVCIYACSSLRNWIEKTKQDEDKTGQDKTKWSKRKLKKERMETDGRTKIILISDVDQGHPFLSFVCFLVFSALLLSFFSSLMSLQASDVRPGRYAPLPLEDSVVHSESGRILNNFLVLVFLMSEDGFVLFYFWWVIHILFWFGVDMTHWWRPTDHICRSKPGLLLLTLKQSIIRIMLKIITS